MKKCILFFLLLVLLMNSFAQVKLKPGTQVKLKAPKFTTSLATFKDTTVISAQQAAAILLLPLKIEDDKKQSYTISSYNFLYKQLVSTEDEATGKTSKVWAIKSSLFKTTPLPPLWTNIVSENLIKGEELFFFDVVVKDAKGNFFMAPDLKFIISK